MARPLPQCLVVYCCRGAWQQHHSYCNDPELSDAISGRDVIITYVKYGKHGLDDFEDDFRRIFYFIEDIEQQVTVWISLSLCGCLRVCVCVCDATCVLFLFLRRAVTY